MINFQYLAGLVDADGHIGLHPSNTGKYRKYYPRLNVTNTSKELMDALVDSFGGAITEKKPGKNSTFPHKKKCWDWRTTGDNARWLIEEVLPFLIVKKTKAIQVLKQDQKRKRIPGA